jgi:hypothetical protein
MRGEHLRALRRWRWRWTLDERAAWRGDAGTLHRMVEGAGAMTNEIHPHDTRVKFFYYRRDKPYVRCYDSLEAAMRAADVGERHGLLAAHAIMEADGITYDRDAIDQWLILHDAAHNGQSRQSRAPSSIEFDGEHWELDN